MKIVCLGTQNVGKTTFIKDFLKKWPMYSTPNKSYRDALKDKNLSHSKSSNEETQTFILNFLVDQAIEYSKKDNVILDRCVLDVLAYSTWLNLNGKVSDNFLDQQRIIIREALKMYDVLFFFPLTKFSPIEIENDGFRETDPVFREEVDTIFKVFGESYNRGDGRIFPTSDSPAFIEIYGNQEQRIQLANLYINDDGTAYGEDESLISDIVPATKMP